MFMIMVTTVPLIIGVFHITIMALEAIMVAVPTMVMVAIVAAAGMEAIMVVIMVVIMAAGTGNFIDKTFQLFMVACAVDS